LVGEDLVKTDKIGQGNFFWSFPSEAASKRQRVIDELTETINNNSQKIKELQKEEQELRKKRKVTDKREENLNHLHTLTEQIAQVETELLKYTDCDPALLEALQEDIQTATEAANRWTDNIWTLRRWAAQKFNVDQKQFNKNFGLPENFDYVET